MKTRLAHGCENSGTGHLSQPRARASGFRTLTLVLLLLPVAAPAVIVDRVAVSVGDKVIIDSEINQRIRLSAFQNQTMPDFSVESRRQAAQKLIDQKLVEREMDVGRYPRLDAEQRKALLNDYDKDKGKGSADLAAYGLKPQDLEDDLARQSDMLTFLNLRFRPAVQVTDQDVQKYFADVIQKGAGKAGQQAQAGALNEIRAQIEQTLTYERADKELDLWLQDQRKRTKILYLEKDLAAEAAPKQ